MMKLCWNCGNSSGMFDLGIYEGEFVLAHGLCEDCCCDRLCCACTAAALDVHPDDLPDFCESRSECEYEGICLTCGLEIKPAA